MTHRLLAIFAALAVAGLIIVLAWSLGPSVVDTAGLDPDDDPIDTEGLDFGSSFGDGSGASGDNPIAGGEQFNYTMVEGDRTTVLRSDRMEQQPRGVSEVWAPAATVRFGDDRAMVVTADRGTFVAPDNSLRSGELRGDVVVEMYQRARGARPGEPIDVEDPAGRSFRVEMEQAEFDLELGQIESTGAVRLIAPGVTFLGSGLSARYSEATDRIERLVVSRGESVTIERGLAELSGDDRGGSGGSGGGGSDALAVGAAATGSTGTAAPPQFYRARFEDDVRIEAPAQGTTMAGRYLETVFTLDAAAARNPGGESNETEAASAPGSESPATADAASPADAQDSTGEPNPTNAPASPDAPSVANANANASRDSGSARGDALPSNEAGETDEMDPSTVTISWSGQLVMAPEPTPPADLAGPDDVLLRLTSPTEAVTIANDRGQSLEAGEVGYLASSQRVTAVGTPYAPMVLQAPQLGTVTGARATLSVADRAAEIFGPGTLTTPNTANLRGLAGPASADDAPNTSDKPDDAGPLSIAWADRLQLAFSPPAAASDAEASDADANAEASAFGAAALGTLREAHFVAEVIARHDGAALDAGEAVLYFEPGPDDQPYPRRLAARQEVRAARDRVELTASELEVTLAEPTDANANGSNANADADADAAIQTLTAQRNVRVRLPESDLQLTGDRLTAQPDRQSLELLAGPDAPAAITRGEATLTGRQIVMHETDQTVQVNGAGTLITPLARPDDGAPAESTAEPSESPTGRLEVTWQDRMRYDNRAGTASFLGEVRGQTRDAGRGSDLQCEDLQITFATVQPANANSTDSGSADPDDPFAGDGPREIRGATAQGEVVFAARSFEPGQPETALTRIRLAGPLMTLENQPPNASPNEGGAADNTDDALPTDISSIGDTQALARGGEADPAAADARRDQPADPDANRTPDAANPRQRLRVVGAGTMLLEDYRLDNSAEGEEQTAADDGSSAGASASANGDGDNAEDAALVASGDRPAALTGRGATLFTWAGGLTLDAAANDMTIVEDVWMIHRPSPDRGETRPITLDCQRLLVDLADAGGLGAWTDDDRPDTEVNRVVADESVVVRQADRSIRSDRATYAADEELLTFDAEGDGLVAVQREGEPVAGRAEQILWYLEPNRIEAIRPAGGVIPLGQ